MYRSYSFLIRKIIIVGSVSNLVEVIKECTCGIQEDILLMESQMTHLGYYSRNVKNPGILALEHQLLSVAATPDLVQGLFYLLPIHYKEKLYLR